IPLLSPSSSSLLLLPLSLSLQRSNDSNKEARIEEEGEENVGEVRTTPGEQRQDLGRGDLRRCLSHLYDRHPLRRRRRRLDQRHCPKLHRQPPLRPSPHRRPGGRPPPEWRHRPPPALCRLPLPHLPAAAPQPRLDPPHRLYAFFVDMRFCFVGVGVEVVVYGLRREYGFTVRNTTDLGNAAARMRGREDLRRAGLELLAREVMCLEMDTPAEVRTSEWWRRDLSQEQIACACADAFVSFQLGCILLC
ncbi:uncharacterized protein LOC109714626, partial [Ananas comosus]|uniref:Uncharacterized protein LOC109714626 n=1 Tax=Ananas comosus TaxID=4615 RepID=A0A6P5FF43_ANACO